MDDEVIDRVRRGETDAFGLLVERHQRKLYYFVVGKVADDSDAREIVQKSFVSAYQNLHRFNRGESFVHWLRGIALNHCRNEWRRRGNQARLCTDWLEVKRAELELAQIELTPGEREPRVVALLECLGELNAEEHRLVQLRFVQELPLTAIGEQVGRTGEAARLWLYRIRMRLARCVKLRLGESV